MGGDWWWRACVVHPLLDSDPPRASFLARARARARAAQLSKERDLAGRLEALAMLVEARAHRRPSSRPPCPSHSHARHSRPPTPTPSSAQLPRPMERQDRFVVGVLARCLASPMQPLVVRQAAAHALADWQLYHAPPAPSVGGAAAWAGMHALVHFFKVRARGRARAMSVAHSLSAAPAPSAAQLLRRFRVAAAERFRRLASLRAAEVGGGRDEPRARHRRRNSASRVRGVDDGHDDERQRP